MHSQKKLIVRRLNRVKDSGKITQIPNKSPLKILRRFASRNNKLFIVSPNEDMSDSILFDPLEEDSRYIADDFIVFPQSSGQWYIPSMLFVKVVDREELDDEDRDKRGKVDKYWDKETSVEEIGEDLFGRQTVYRPVHTVYITPEYEESSIIVRALSKSSVVKNLIVYGRNKDNNFSFYSSTKRGMSLYEYRFNLYKIPPYIINSHIKSLTIIGLNLRDITPFEEILKESKTLKFLNLSANAFTDITPLANGLRYNNTLEDLILDIMVVSGGIFTSTFVMYNYINLQRDRYFPRNPNYSNALQVTRRNIPRKDDRYIVTSIQPLAEVLETNTSLKTLSLLGHDIMDLYTMGRCLKRNTTLEGFLVHGRDHHIDRFCQGLKENKGLKFIVIGLLCAETGKLKLDLYPLYEVMLTNRKIIVSTQEGRVPPNLLARVRYIHPTIHEWNFKNWIKGLEYDTDFGRRSPTNFFNTSFPSEVGKIYSIKTRGGHTPTLEHSVIPIYFQTLKDVEELEKRIEQEEAIRRRMSRE